MKKAKLVGKSMHRKGKCGYTIIEKSEVSLASQDKGVNSFEVYKTLENSTK